MCPHTVYTNRLSAGQASIARNIKRPSKMSKQDVEQLWELQGRQAELRRHVMQLTSQINVAERERSILDITVREMDAMPDQTKTYMAIGKMFAFAPKDQLRGELLQAKEESFKKDEGRSTLRDQFVTKLKESENRIDEIAKQIEDSRARAKDSSPARAGS